MRKEDHPHSWLVGKRVIIIWTDRAHAKGADWVAFKVIDTDPDTIWIQGVESPCGSPHNGSKCSAKLSEVRDIIEWKGGA
jgi:hypothetical protein